MRAADTASRLEGFEGRGAGTDAERRAAEWLARELRASNSEALIETFWCRPNWALAHAWHVGLALAGGLVSVPSPRVGAALLLAALICMLADELTGISPGRRLTPERASQNVAAPPRDRTATEPHSTKCRLILTANYDAGRIGLVYREGARRATRRLGAATANLSPGWLGWLVITIAWLLVTAILRLEGHRSHVIGLIQLPPTVGLVLTLALLLDLAIGDWGPAAGDNGSGVAVALDLARALSAGPPANLDVELVLTGAGDGGGIGLRRYLRPHARERAHAGERAPADTVVLGFAACAAGTPCWWVSDGPLLPLRYAPRLRALCAQVGGRPHRGRGVTPAFRARTRRLPAITIGCLDDRELVPRSHRRTDTAAKLDRVALDQAVQFALLLVDAIDAALGEPQTSTTAATRA